MKIKKVLFILLIIISASVSSFAQYTYCTLADIEKLKQEGTVIVALSDDDVVNKMYDDVMKSTWTASKYKVIKFSELKSYTKENPENYVFTYFVKVGTSGLMLCHNFKKENSSPKKSGAMIFGYFDTGLLVLNKQAEFTRLVGFMNGIFTFPNLQENKIGGWKVPTANTKEVIAKELWITESDINKKEEEKGKMKSTYDPYKYKIVTKEEIVKAILEKRKDIVYLANVPYDAGLAYDSDYKSAQQCIFIIHDPGQDNRILFFAGGQGFDSNALQKIKDDKQYGQ